MNQKQAEASFIETEWSLLSHIHHFSHEAMATTFGIFIQNEDGRYARQAAKAAFDEVDRLEAELSRFIENSDISRLNNLSAGKPLILGLDAFECLKLSAEIYTQTNGAFDVTIGPLLNCWRNTDGSLRRPTEKELSSAREHVGTNLLKLNEIEHTVELSPAEGGHDPVQTGEAGSNHVQPFGLVQVDLGGIGKGYALDCVAELLRQWSINNALVHGGYSSVLALNAPSWTGSSPPLMGWPLTLSNPAEGKQTLARVILQRSAVSGSGLQKGSHIIDPRTGWPVKGKRAAWAFANSAVVADALSTAFMIMTGQEIEQYCLGHPEVRALVILEEPQTKEDKVLHFGRWEKGELVE